MKVRKNITISEVMLARAQEVMQARGFDDFSEYVGALIREAYERYLPGEPLPERKADPTEEEIASHIAEVRAQHAQLNEPSSSPLTAAAATTQAALTAGATYGAPSLPPAKAPPRKPPRREHSKKK